jgi:hypothetical protein
MSQGWQFRDLLQRGGGHGQPSSYMQKAFRVPGVGSRQSGAPRRAEVGLRASNLEDALDARREQLVDRHRTMCDALLQSEG